MAPIIFSHNICRICLNERNITLPLSTKLKSITVAEKINICASVHIEMGDKYPQNVCMTCYNNLNISYEFKTLCQNSEQQLFKFYKSNNEVGHNTRQDNISDVNDFKLFANSEITVKKEVVKGEKEDNKCSLKEECEDRKTSAVNTEHSNDSMVALSKLLAINLSKRSSTTISHLIKNKQLTLKILKSNLRYVKSDSQPRIIINFDRRFLIEEYPFKDLVSNFKNDLEEELLDCQTNTTDKNYLMKLRSRKKTTKPNNNFGCYDSDSSLHNDYDDSDYTEFKTIKTEASCEDKFHGEGEGRILNYDSKYLEQKSRMNKVLKEKKVKEPKKKCIKNRYEQTICPICGKMLRSNMKRHIEVFHKGKRLFTCNICQRTFKDKAYLLDHENQHTGNKKYLCTLCGMAFVQLSGYRQHMKRHPEISSNKCTHCPKVFRTPGLLKDHMNIHNGDRKYGCKICQERFFTNATLRRHSIIHKERRHKCEICKKLFHGRHELGRHMLVHTGIKPFQCDVCAAKFTQKSDMKKHILRHFKAMDGTSCNVIKPTATTSQYRISSNPSYGWQGG